MCKTLKRVKFLLYFGVECYTQRNVGQNVGTSLAGEQELYGCDQSIAVCAALRRVCYTLEDGL